MSLLGPLANTTAYVLSPKTSFDGLGDDVSAENPVASFPCRVRQLTAREQFQIQGTGGVSTFRIYAEGDLDDYPDIKAEAVISVNETWYVVKTTTQGLGIGPLLFQLDCNRYTGI